MTPLRDLGLAVAILSASIAPASADVIYAFTLAAPMLTNPDSPYTVSPTTNIVPTAVLVVSDDAYMDGFSVRGGYGYSTPASASLDGFVAINVGILNVVNPLNYDIDDFMTRPMQSGYQAMFNLSSEAGGLLSGTIDINNTEHEVSFVFDGTSVTTGMFNSDAVPSCWGTGCRFTGMTSVAVPEPASLALFGVALVGLLAARKRRRA